MRTISLVVLVSFFMSGCATMFNGTTESINLRSEESDTVFFVNDREIGKGTSAVSELPKKNLKTAVLRAEKTGCTTQSSLIETEFDATSLLGILIDFGLISILVVDWAATGAITKAAQRNYILTPKCSNAVAVLERAKKPVASQPQLPPGLPPEIAVFVGKWEGSWDNRKDLNFTLTIPNINLEVAEVNYQSKDLNFSEKAKVISGEKPKIEWMIHPKVFVAIPGGAMPIWFTFEIQREGTLKGILDDRSVSGPVMRKAVLRKVD